MGFFLHQVRQNIASRLSVYLALSCASFMAVLLASSFQHVMGVAPCTMCILQRYMFLFIAALGLMMSRAGARTVRILRPVMVACAGAGVYGSLRIHNALATPSVSCGRDAFEEFLNGLPTADWLPEVFRVTGLCGTKIPGLLGVPLHVWSALLFIAVVVVVARQVRQELLATPK